MEYKKHYSQMTKDEADYVLNAVRSNQKFKMHKHAIERMFQKNITIKAIAETVVKGSVIEVNNNRNDIRVLLTKRVGNERCCVVVGLKSREVITCYWNDATDDNRSIDMTRYTWNVNLKNVVKSTY